MDVNLFLRSWISKNRTHVKLMGTKDQGHATRAPGYPGGSNFSSKLHLVQRTYGAKIRKIYYRVFAQIDFVKTRFRPLSISKLPKQQKNSDRILKTALHIYILTYIHAYIYTY